MYTSYLFIFMLKMFVQMSGIILWSFVRIRLLLKFLERSNRSKVGSSENIFALPATTKCSDFPNLPLDVHYFCLSTLILSVCMHTYQQNCQNRQIYHFFWKKSDFLIFSSKNLNVRSKNGACTLNS